MQEADEGRALALATAAYSEERSDWASFSAALNGYTVLSYRVGADHDALEASRRRLGASDLPVTERADALQLMVATFTTLGNLSRCIEVVRDALAQLRPGEPVVHFDAAIGSATWALLFSGRWSEIGDFMPALEDIWEQIQHDVGATTHIAGSYVCVLPRGLGPGTLLLQQTGQRTRLARCLPRGRPDATSIMILRAMSGPYPS